jgi:hypothetical protein
MTGSFVRVGGKAANTNERTVFSIADRVDPVIEA